MARRRLLTDASVAFVGWVLVIVDLLLKVFFTSGDAPSGNG